MNDGTEAVRELVAAQKAIIEKLTEQVELQRSIIAHHETVGTWRTAVREGHATTDEMEAAFTLEDEGEIEHPLPKGYVRHEGRIVRLSDDGTPEPPPPSVSGLDVSTTYLGSLG